MDQREQQHTDAGSTLPPPPSLPTPSPPESPASTPPDDEVVAADADPSEARAGEDEGVAVTVDALPVLSYAAAHNRVPVVRTVTLASDVDVQGARLVITIRDDEGAIAEPVEQAVDLIAGQITEVITPGVRLEPSTLLQIRERRPAWITAEVTGESVLGKATVEATVLAGTQWLAAPPGVAFELLAAYVMPNDPAVTQVLVDAGEYLGRATGHPSLDGYQSGSPDRVDAMVRAIWDAVQARAVRYSMPPASWADIGQKIRTPADVLEGRLGTCLDTTLVLAAALEQAGIRPLLVVTTGHAFLGYWRYEGTLDAIAYASGHDVVNDIDLGHIGVIETTLVTERPEPASFDEAVRSAMTLVRQPDDIIAVVDVWQARQAGVVPVPVRRVLDDGTVQIVGYHAADTGDRRLVIEPQGERTEVRPTVREAPPRVQQWKNSLLDLSLRNRLINYTERAGVAIRVPQGMLGQIEDVVSARRPLSLCPDDQIEEVDRARGIHLARDLPDERARAQLVDRQAVYTDVLSGGYQTRMRGLANRARTIQEETGANNLYLALGSLAWELDGRRLRSPLVLVPVRLTITSRRTLYRMELDDSGGSTPNYCLLEKLKQVHGIELPGFAEPEEDEFGIDIDAAFRAIREAIARKALPFHVEERADLSILQFAKFRLWKDLDEHWEELAANPLVQHLIETPTDPFVDPVPATEHIDLDALDGVCPMPADASQLEAVAEAVAGRTFVLEGPPGTGKSQTITNLLTRAVAAGRRVLFVAEKRAALDVVSSRLDATGMGVFALDLHDKAARPNVVRSQIVHALDHAVFVDREGFELNEEDLRSSRRTLARYAERLHEENPAGLSYYTARTRLLALGADGVVMDVPRSLLSDPVALDRMRSTLRDLPDVASIAVPTRNHPWGFVALTAIESSTESAVLAAVRMVDEAVAVTGRLPDEVRAVALSARNVGDLQALSRLAAYPVPLGDLDASRSDDWQRSKDALVTAIAAVVAGPHPVMTTLAPEALQLPVAEIHAEAQAAESSGFLGRRKRRKAVAARLAVAARPGVEVDPRAAAGLAAELLQLRSAVDLLVQQCRSVAGVTVPDGWNPLAPDEANVIERQVQWIEWTGRAIAPSASAFTTALRSWMQSAPTADAQVTHVLASLADAFERLADAAGAQPATWDRWCGADGLVSRWSGTAESRDRDRDLVLLRRWVALAASLEVLRGVGLHAAADAVAVGELDAEDATRALERGVARASIDERAEATGLHGFDPEVHERAVRRFTSSLGNARTMMTSVVPQEVVSSRPFDAASGLGRVGELRRELAKQRRGLGVRALMERYGDLIIQLMPMVLVSPDSIARFFPVGSQTFDLVVFDEASQIRVADAIGAMGRARSVVVVGDSKQMPPTSFGEPAAGSHDVDLGPSAAVEDEESILTEAVMARVPQRWLRWHYRSQDESLIAFSNSHYYDGKLSSFPAPTHAAADPLASGRGIALVRVDGRFLRDGVGAMLRTNPVEAEAIVDEVRRRFAESPDVVPSVGIVTFNQQQRDYIEGLLRDTADERCIEALDTSEGDGLFVKNLENVQGDERDVILFSTAFSVNDKGVLPLNFGPLTRAGGERRLNVAITRARRQVIIYSSFDPQDLRVEQTSSVGISHLRRYMEWAVRGADARQGVSTPVVDRHRDEIAACLRQRGLGVQTDVGLSEFRIDLTLAPPDRPDEPVVAVLLDGPPWAGRRTVGDRDGLPTDVLGKLLSWPSVERVWLPRWLRDPEGTLDHLVAATQRASVATPEPAPPTLSPSRPSPPPSLPPPSPPAASSWRLAAPTGEAATADLVGGVAANRSESSTYPTPAVASSALAPPAPAPPGPASLPNEVVFQAFEPTIRGSRTVLDGLPSAASVSEVGRVLHEVIAAEGPVRLTRLARLVAACFDLTRLSPARIAAITSLVPAELVRDEPDFAWPSAVEPGSWRAFRSSRDASVRSLDELSLAEIANAMVGLCTVSAGMSAAELDTEALLVFGGRRKTAGIQARLTAARDYAVSTGRLRATGDHYEVAEGSRPGSAT